MQRKSVWQDSVEIAGLAEINHPDGHQLPIGPVLVHNMERNPDSLLLEEFFPSTDYGQGGPILLNNFIHSGGLNDGSGWFANLYGKRSITPKYSASGETQLIAAMRCFVTSKLGKVVDIPSELLTIN